MTNKSKILHKDNPLFSIIIAAYNTEKWIARCLKCILVQNFNDYELIIINDGSTDKTLEICYKFQEKHNNIRIINKKHSGLVDTRNTGIKQAIGKYICYIDADDLIDVNYLKTLNSIIAKHNNVDMIIFNYKEIRKDVSFINGLIFNYYNKPIAEGFYNKEDLNKYIYPYIFYIGNFILSDWRSIYKRSILLKHLNQELNLSNYTDYCYTYEYIYNCNFVYFCNKTLYFYNRKNEKSITAQNAYSYDSFIKLFNYIAKRLCPKNEHLNKYIQISFFERLQILLYRERKYDKTTIKELNNSVLPACKYFKLNYCQNSHDYFMLLALKTKQLYKFLSIEKYIYKDKIRDNFVKRTQKMRSLLSLKP